MVSLRWLFGLLVTDERSYSTLRWTQLVIGYSELVTGYWRVIHLGMQAATQVNSRRVMVHIIGISDYGTSYRSREGDSSLVNVYRISVQNLALLGVRLYVARIV